MNKKEKIADLESKLAQAEKLIAKYVEKLVAYEQAQLATPEGCTPGRWCEACAFRDVISVSVYDGSPYRPFASCRYVDLNICGRNKCKEFIRKDPKEVSNK